MSHSPLGPPHFVLMAEFVRQWDAQTEVPQVEPQDEPQVRALVSSGLLVRPDPGAAEVWPPQLPLGPYPLSGFRPRCSWAQQIRRHIELPAVADDALRARWAVHGEISGSLEWCNSALWQMMLLPRGGGCLLTSNGLTACGAAHLSWLSTVLPVFTEAVSDIRLEASDWVSAMRAGTHRGPAPDWLEIIGARLRPLRAYWHESTVRFFEQK